MSDLLVKYWIYIEEIRFFDSVFYVFTFTNFVVC